MQLLSGKAKEETEAMKEGTAVHDAREAEVVSRISVAVTSPEVRAPCPHALLSYSSWASAFGFLLQLLS